MSGMARLRVLFFVLAACCEECAPACAIEDYSIYLHPGVRVAAGDGVRLNLYCTGSGAATVVFDAGHQDWAPAWSTVQPRVALWTRTCSYDRAGSGFSDEGLMPRTSLRIVEELHSALRNAGVSGPYILVGHAFGGINMRTFAYLYMPETAALVLIDSDTGDVDPPDVVEHRHTIFAVQGAELRACRDALASGKPLSSVPPSKLQPGITCEQRFFRGFPEKAWSPELNAALLKDARTRLQLFQEVVSELEEMPGDEVWLKEHQQSLGARPIRVVTDAAPYPDDENTPPAMHLRHLKVQYERAFAQARFLELSSDAKQLFAYHSAGAYIQFDQPELVVRAIRDAYDHIGSRR